MLSVGEIEKLIQVFEKKIKNKNIEDYLRLGTHKDKIIEEAHFNAKFFKKIDSSEMLQSIYSVTKWKVKAEFLVFMIMNRKMPISKQIQKYSVIEESYDEEEGILRYLTVMETKKILMIQPRYMIEVNCIKKLKDNKFIQIS